MEELKKALAALGVSESAITVLSSSEKPDGYDEATTIQSLVKEREDFFTTKFKPSIEADYKQRTEKASYAATIKPIQSRLKKSLVALGATKEQLENLTGEAGIDPKGAIDLYQGLFEKREAEKNTATTNEDLEEARKNVTKWKNEADARAEELELTRANFDIEKQKMLSDYDAKETARNKVRVFSEVLSRESFKGIKTIGHLPDVMQFYMKAHGYDIHPPAEEGGKWRPVAADGTPAIAIDGNRTYKDKEEMLMDIARHNNLFPEHNGGQDRQVGNERIIEGKKVNVGGASYLKHQMGI